jgi:hypothetical protein
MSWSRREGLGLIGGLLAASLEQGVSARGTGVGLNAMAKAKG